MTALKDLWQQQRLQRQQEVAQRQQQVRERLVQMQQERLTNSAALQDELHQFQLKLQQETQTFLSHVSTQRKQRAQDLVKNLREFTAALQIETSQFLSLTQAERQLRAEEIFRSLNLFHNELVVTVEALRKNLHAEIQALRAEVQQICADTQVYLNDCQQKRVQDQIQLAETLATYVQKLQAEVSTYMAELSHLDVQRAQELRVRFEQQRQHRAMEMEGLFEDLAVFRGELREYCAGIRALVWGNGENNAAVTTNPSPTSTALTQSAPEIKTGTRQNTPPTPQPVAPPAPAAAPSSSSPSAVEPPPALATPDTSIATFAASVSDPSPDQNAAVEMSWGDTPVTLAHKDAVDLEQRISSYLQQSKGARLTEIESALDINRFQAVDALRSLIKKGRVTQRDRVYVIQEESIL